MVVNCGIWGNIMNKRIFIIAVFDSFIQSLLLVCLGTFSISVYSSKLSLNQYLLIGVLSAILSAVVYVVVMLKESNNKKLVCFLLLGLLCFVLSMVLMLAILIIFKFNFIPLREVNNADGILILYTTGCYILVSFILRLCAFVISIIKNIRTKTKNTGNGFSC